MSRSQAIMIATTSRPAWTSVHKTPRSYVTSTACRSETLTDEFCSDIAEKLAASNFRPMPRPPWSGDGGVGGVHADPAHGRAGNDRGDQRRLHPSPIARGGVRVGAACHAADDS